MPDNSLLALMPALTRTGHDTASHHPSLHGDGTALATPISPKRARFIGFATDSDSAAIVNETLAATWPDAAPIHIMDFRSALALLAGMQTPEIVLVDLSGEEQPINALTELADAVDPGTTVLAIGEIQNVNFYRTITKGMGVKEYLAKPLSQASLVKNFRPVTQQLNEIRRRQRGGRIISVVGTRGGVGASTIASNLAWTIGTAMHRHTLLLDTELHTGTAALNFNVSVGNHLGTALATPERLDTLLIERATHRASDRLDLLAGQELLEHDVDYKPGTAAMLMQAVRSRYNYVIADAGSRLETFGREVMSLAHQRVIVMDPSIVSVRNFEKLLTLHGEPGQSPRVLVVLNNAGIPGGLKPAYMEQTLGLRFDAIIPDLPRIVPKTTQHGTQAASLRGPFRDAISSIATSLGATVLAEAA